MSITENEWLLINDIILDIYRSVDDKEMRKRFLRKIRFLIPYSKANFFLASPDQEHYIQDPVDMGFDDGYLHDYFGELEKHDFMNWIYASAQNNVYLLTELLPAEELNKSLYFRRYFIPNNMEYAAILSLSYNGTHLGVLTLFRAKEDSDFLPGISSCYPFSRTILPCICIRNLQWRRSIKSTLRLSVKLHSPMN